LEIGKKYGGQTHPFVTRETLANFYTNTAVNIMTNEIQACNFSRRSWREISLGKPRNALKDPGHCYNEASRYYYVSVWIPFFSFKLRDVLQVATNIW